MAIITTAKDTTTNKDLFKVGSLREIFDNTVRSANTYSSRLYKMEKTDLLTERVLRMAGFGLAEEMVEGQNVPLQTPPVGTTKEYTQRFWGSGFRMTDIADRYNKYKLWAKYAKSLGLVMTETKDVELAVPFNSPTSTALTCGVGFDTMAIGNDAHTGLESANTDDNYDNYLNAGMSYTSLSDARYYFKTIVDDRGLHMGATPDVLYYEPTLHPTAVELTKSLNRAGEISNTTNDFIKGMGLELYEYPRLTSTTAWGMGATKDSNYDFHCYTALEPKTYTKDAPDNTLDKIMIARQDFTYGWGDPRLILIGKT